MRASTSGSVRCRAPKPESGATRVRAERCTSRHDRQPAVGGCDGPGDAVDAVVRRRRTSGRQDAVDPHADEVGDRVLDVAPHVEAAVRRELRVARDLAQARHGIEVEAPVGQERADDEASGARGEHELGVAQRDVELGGVDDEVARARPQQHVHAHPLRSGDGVLDERERRREPTDVERDAQLDAVRTRRARDAHPIHVGHGDLDTQHAPTLPAVAATCAPRMGHPRGAALSLPSTRTDAWRAERPAMALDPRQQIVAVTAANPEAAVVALLGFIDHGPGARILSIALDSQRTEVSGTTRRSTSELVLLAVVEHAVAPPPGQVPPYVAIRG